MSPEERDLFERRRRARNIAILIALAALAVLFYFMGLARLRRG